MAEKLTENPLYSLLVSNVGWVMQDEPDLEKAEGLFDYYNDGTYKQVTLWSTIDPDPIKEAYHEQEEEKEEENTPYALDDKGNPKYIGW